MAKNRNWWIFWIIFFLNFQNQLIYGWTISIVLLTIALVLPKKMGNLDYKYNSYDAAIYAAFSPITYCTIFAWIIYTTHIGYSSKLKSSFRILKERPDNNLVLFSAFISEILSCRLFLITTRLAYAVYLTQFPIFFYNVGTTRHSGYYHFFTSTVNEQIRFALRAKPIKICSLILIWNRWMSTKYW